MPYAARRPCTWPGCSQLVQLGSRCDPHRRLQDQQRGSATQRGYGDAWRKAREAFLRSHPLCKHCEDGGHAMPATVVDHKVPHRGDKALFWDHANWQPLCKPCHDRKTASEDGGFGHAPTGGRSKV